VDAASVILDLDTRCSHAGSAQLDQAVSGFPFAFRSSGFDAVIDCVPDNCITDRTVVDMICPVRCPRRRTANRSVCCFRGQFSDHPAELVVDRRWGQADSITLFADVQLLFPGRRGARQEGGLE